jgi:putative peptidoglycan lipid II flippase
MSSAFIPVLTETQTRQTKAAANRLVRAVFLFALVAVGGLCLLGIIFAPAIVTAIAPGFLEHPEKFADTVLLTRLMFPFLLFISLASLVMGALNTRGVFFIPALAPALLNVVTIICVVLLVSRFANPIIAVAIGITLGGLVQFLFQVPAFWRQGYAFFRRTAGEEPLTVRAVLGHPGLRRIGGLILPATMGMAVAQINIFISTILASFLVAGSITYLYYSMRLIQFPIGIFGVAMGMAVLPALSEHAAKKDMVALKEDFSFALRFLFFITVPAMTGLIFLSFPIVNALFERGVFDHAATIGTSQALICYALGIWAIVGVRIVTVTFYSMQDTKTPVKIAVLGMLVNIAFSFALMGPLGHNGLALANSIAAASNFILLFTMLKRRLGSIGTKRILTSFAKTVVAAVMMGWAGYAVTKSELWDTAGRLSEKVVCLGSAICLCVAVYGIISYALKSEELDYVLRKVKERRRTAS